MFRIAVFSLLFAATAGAADYSLVESFAPGTVHSVDCRVSLSGELLVPVGEGKPPRKVAMKGDSGIEYDERLLAADRHAPEGKSLRVYRKLDFKRTVGDQPQEANLRKEVSRIVIMKGKDAKTSFSPDGPLTWGEIDTLRTDLFLPALSGLLPSNRVKIGDTWKVSAAACHELTDMETESGALEGTLIEETRIGDRKVAHVKIRGELKGANEDGPARQKINCTLYFDLEQQAIVYLSVRGEQQLLDKDQKPVGNIEGQCVLTRKIGARPGLDDATVRKLQLDPDDDNTLLLYENPDLGLKLLHSRRWRVGRVQGRQVTLDENGGSGLLITVEPTRLVPATEAYLRESKAVLEQRKVEFLSAEKPNRLSKEPVELDKFGFEIESNNQRATMDYYVSRQAKGGAVLAARIVGRDRVILQREIERLARSLEIVRGLER